ncbi:MAG: hypothetical protein AAB092_01395 [Chloroflexota bacterium]
MTIRLTDERWEHILDRHPALHAMQDEIIQTVADPDTIYEGEHGEIFAARIEHDLYLIVAYRETSTEDGFIITSYLTSEPIDRRVLWKR